jgi:hypothetical protein
MAMTDSHLDPESIAPLFYRRPTLLRFADHAGWGLAPHRGYGFAAGAHAVPLNAAEFMPALRHYPIVFAAGVPTPLAVLGLEQSHNLFVADDGAWRPGHYIPGYARRYPFIIMESPDRATRLLAIDAASERLAALDNKEAGEAVESLFDDTGDAAPLAKSAMDFCRVFHDQHLGTMEFVGALAATGLLTLRRADIRYADASRASVDGFQVVDEQAFHDLPADTVAQWHARGWLALINLHLASQANWSLLIDLQARAQADDTTQSMTVAHEETVMQ